MASWKELAAFILFIGTVSSQGFHTGLLSSVNSHAFGPQAHFGSSGLSGFGTSFGHSSFRPRNRGSLSHISTSGVSAQDPPEIRRLLGSSVIGREMRMGERGLPRHGGAGAGPRHSNGLLRGWDGNPQTLGGQFVDPWRDPFNGGPVPPIVFGGGMLG